tara:strand:+ start:134 stop:568 length:435 start_codon:yes stop_codon:yes gene_type:complete
MLNFNQKIKFKTIEISFHIHSTEELDKSIRIICDNLKMPIERKNETKLIGAFNNEIKKITFILQKSECDIFLNNLVDKMMKAYKKEIIEQIDNHIDIKGIIYLRVDKQRLIKNEIVMGINDIVRIKMKAQTKNDLRENMIKLLS